MEKPEEIRTLHTFRDGSTIRLEISQDEWLDSPDLLMDFVGSIEPRQRYDEEKFMCDTSLRTYREIYTWSPCEGMRKEYRDRFRLIRQEKPNEGRREIERLALAWWQERIQDVLKIWQQYLDGEVFGFQVYHADVEIGACWGFYGRDHDESGLIDAAMADFKGYMDEQAKLDAMIRC